MGCKLTKVLVRKDITAKGMPLELPDLPTPLEPDPRLPLTARQKFSIIKSWKGISRAIEPTGVAMFLKLFEEHSNLLSLFDKFKDLRTRDAQAESLELAEHATVVMNSIDEGIRAMDNVDFFFELLQQIGASHRKVPGFKKEYFWKMENPFLEAVRQTLDDRYTGNVDQIYRITIRLILETMITGYEMAKQTEVNDNHSKEDIQLTENASVPSKDDIKSIIANIRSSASSSQSSSRSSTVNNAPRTSQTNESCQPVNH